MEDDYYTVLWREFSADGNDTFLLQLRVAHVWDTVAFTRLTEAMLACCKAYSLDDVNPMLLGPAYDKSVLPRWLAEGFWYVPAFVRGHTAHEAWRERLARHQAYYDRAYQRLDALADWFFTGQYPYIDRDAAFKPM